MLCKDRRFDHGKPFRLAWFQPTCKSRTKIFFHQYRIINSIPAEWRSVVKATADVSVSDPLPNTPTIRMESDNLV